jgi:glutamate-1-semialdehyde aminotransferase
MQKGVFLVPKANKRCHISAAHTKEDILYTVNAAKETLAAMKSDSSIS